MEELHVSAYSGHLQVLTTFLLRVLYNMPKSRGDVEMSTSPRGLDTLLTRKLSKPEESRYRPKHVVLPLLINTNI